MINSSDMRKLEELSEKHGVSKLDLMENAGRGMYTEIIQRYSLKNKKIIVICGSGNNGGDGFVLAKYFKERDYSVNVLFIGDENRLKKESGYNYFLLKKKFPDIFMQEKNLAMYDIIVDAMLGTGIKGKIKEPYSSMTEAINNAGKTVISVDVPSGLDSDTGEILGKMVNADIILTFHDTKLGLAKFNEKVVVIDIGIPEKAVEELYG